MRRAERGTSMHRSVVLCGVTSFLFAVLGTALVLAVALPGQVGAQSTSAGAVSGGPDEHFVGSWLTSVTIDNGGGQYLNTNMYSSDGTVMNATFGTNPALQVSAGQGSWLRTGDHTYGVTLIRILRNADGVQTLQRVRASYTLNATSDGLTGRFVSDTLDASGNAISSATGTIQASRITVQPLA